MVVNTNVAILQTSFLIKALSILYQMKNILFTNIDSCLSKYIGKRFSQYSELTVPENIS